MIKISKQERLELEKQGVAMGYNGISRTLSQHYYLTESSINLAKLNKIRNKKK